MSDQESGPSGSHTKDKPWVFPALIVAIALLQAAAIWGVYQHAFSEGSRRSSLEAIEVRISQLQKLETETGARSTAATSRADEEAEAARKKLQALRDEIAADQRHADEARGSLRPLQQELDGVNERLATANQTLEEAKRRSTLEADHEAESKAALAKLADDIAASTKQLVEMKAELATLGSSAAEAKLATERAQVELQKAEKLRLTNSEELGRLSGERDALAKTVEERRGSLKTLEAELASLEPSVALSRKSKGDTDAELQEARGRLKSVQEDIKSADERLASLRSEVTEAQARAESAKTEAVLRGEIRAQTLAQQVEELQKKKDSLSGEVTGLEEVTSRLRTDLASLKSTGENSKEVVEALTSARSALAEELKHTTEELERLVALQKQLRELKPPPSPNPPDEKQETPAPTATPKPAAQGGAK